MPLKHLLSQLDNLTYKNPKCFFPGCQSTPINSHTIPENFLYKMHNDLTQVLTFHPLIAFFTDKAASARIKQIDKSQFSTFPGFCSTHDEGIFKPIDQYNGKLDNEKAALVHYRNICYGIYHIETQRLRLEYVANQIFIPDESSSKKGIKKTLEQIKSGILLCRLNSCLNQHLQRKELLEEMIIAGNFNKIDYQMLSGGLNNPIFCGRSSYLLHKDNGLFKKDGYPYFPWISYMTLLTKHENHLVFCWLKKDNAHAKRLKN